MHHQVKLDATFLSLVIAVAVVEVMWEDHMWCWPFFFAGPRQEPGQWTGPGCSCHAIRHESWLQDLIITQSNSPKMLCLQRTYRVPFMSGVFCFYQWSGQAWRAIMASLSEAVNQTNETQVEQFRSYSWVCLLQCSNHSWNDQPMF